MKNGVGVVVFTVPLDQLYHHFFRSKCQLLALPPSLLHQKLNTEPSGLCSNKASRWMVQMKAEAWETGVRESRRRCQGSAEFRTLWGERWQPGTQLGRERGLKNQKEVQLHQKGMSFYSIQRQNKSQYHNKLKQWEFLIVAYPQDLKSILARKGKEQALIRTPLRHQTKGNHFAEIHLQGPVWFLAQFWLCPSGPVCLLTLKWFAYVLIS